MTLILGLNPQAFQKQSQLLQTNEQLFLLFIHSCSYSPNSNDDYILNFWSRSCCKLDFGPLLFS